MIERAFSGFVALPAPKAPHEVLGVEPNATGAEIDAAYRRKAKALHPDVPGGVQNAMAELNVTRDTLKGKAA